MQQRDKGGGGVGGEPWVNERGCLELPSPKEATWHVDVSVEDTGGPLGST